MADIKLTTADTSGFIPQYWANRALDVLRAQIVLANLVAKDVDFGEAGWKGKSITVPYPGTFSAVDKVADTPATPQVPVGGASVTLTLSKHKVVPFLVEDFAAAQANMSLMDRYVEPAVIALAEQFETDLYNQYLNLTTTALGTVGTDITAAVVRSAMKGLNDQKAPTQDRFLVVSTKDQIALLGDSTLATYFAYNQTPAIRKGYIGPLYGMDTYYSQLVQLGYTATVSTDTTGGTFTLTFNGQTTSALAYNATAATVQTAFLLLSSVGAGNATVTGGPGATAAYSINFTGSLAGTTLAVTGSGASLTGGTHTLTITTATRDLALHKNAFMFACRPFAPIPSNAGVMSAQANDPESGLSIRISTQYDINNIGQRVNLDILYGITTLRATQGIVINT